MRRIVFVVLVAVAVLAVGCSTRKAADRSTPQLTGTSVPAAEPLQPRPTQPPSATDAAITEPGEPTATDNSAEQPNVHPTASLTSEPTATLQVQLETQDTPSPADELVARLQGLDLEAFFEASFRELMLRNPELVLEVGLTEVYGVTDVQLTDISDAYIRETQQMHATILEMLRGYDREALALEQQISYDVYEWYLEDQVRGQAFMYYDYPATYFPTTAVHEQLIQFFRDIHPISSQQDAQDYIARLEQVDTKFEQLLEGLKLREQAGIIPPQFAIQWALYSIRDLTRASATATPFYTSFEEKVDALQNVSDDEKQMLLASAGQAIEEVVLPAYQKLADYLERLETVAPTDDGVWQFPEGDAYYDYLLHHYTTTELTADQIHKRGLDELERIHAEMRAVFDELGYPENESLARLFDRVAQDGGHVAGNRVLETYEALIGLADQNLEAVFDIRPVAQVIVVADLYGGFYVPGSMDGSRPGAFYAAVGGDGEDLYGMPTLAYHEAIPGHHLQIAIAQEMDLPSFRRGLSFTGYTEGWALYAERLAWELGWYEDNPYGNLGRLQAEAFRAARLVVDTGIHVKGWTFDQALDFFVENVGYESGDIVDPRLQIARYIVWPGQSTAYKVGMLELLELRQRAMDQLGDRFDLKEFHDVVLGNGSMPLEILSRVVDGYILGKLDQ